MKKRVSNQPPFCPSKRPLKQRALLTTEQSLELKGLFKVLANETRLRMVHALVRAGELCVHELAEAIRMKPQAVCNQLQRLVDRGILGSRRSGNNVYYRIVDPCVPALVDKGLCLVEDEYRRKQLHEIRPAIR